MPQRANRKSDPQSAQSPRRNRLGSITIIIIIITTISRLPREALRPRASSREQPVAFRWLATFTPAFPPAVELR
jgi:hypothetical protein